MHSYKLRLKFLAQLLCFLLLLYSFVRLLFYLFNYTAFADCNSLVIFKAFFYALKFDVSAIAFTNIITIAFLAFPYNLIANKFLAFINKIIFVSLNSISLLINLSDCEYFKYSNKRISFDLVNQLTTNQISIKYLLPTLLLKHWYIFIIFSITVFSIVFAYNKCAIKLNYQNNFNEIKPKYFFLFKSIIFSTVISFTIIFMRGGLQLVPITIINAGDNVSVKLIPLVLNNPFNIMKSTDQNFLQIKNYYANNLAFQNYPLIKQNNSLRSFKKENIVIIILESFSKEYTKLGVTKSNTPFLDSLMDCSLNFTNAYANGKKSIEAIPAILSSIPSFEIPYINSIYSSNKIQSIASILKQENYYSSFYHGGINGTMNFNSYTSIAGFNKYFGINEYNNDKDFDDCWGIWDEPFLNKYASELNKHPQPFISTVFTLSSHHPFNLPSNYKDKFPAKEMPILKCISYTDNSLRLFFNQIKKSNWYKNTLFIITADHTGTPSNDFNFNSIGSFQIPLLFFKPDNSLKGENKNLIQHLDILPSILDYLNFNKNFVAFGNSAFKTEQNKFVINMLNNNYLIMQNDTLILFNGTNPTALFNYKTDSLLKSNFLEPKIISNQALIKLKSFIQIYNYSLINNKTFIP